MTLKYLTSPEERRKKLKQALEKKNLIRGIEVHNALSALIANDLKVESNKGGLNEFDFFWESSLTDSASKGHPDIEIISFDSRLRTIHEILSVTDKPMIVDGDTGGDIHHFEYLIPKLEAEGVSAVIIEDKVFPKRNSLDSEGTQTQEDPDRFAQKIKAGKEIQRTPNFMIIARIESLIVGKTVEDALERAKKYLEVGVDGIMIHSKSKDPKEIILFAREYAKICNQLNVRKPLVVVPTAYNSIYESELADEGVNVVIYANHFLRASYKAMQNVGEIILKNERSLEADQHICSVKEVFEKVGYLDIKEKDKLLDITPSIIILAAGENPELKHILGDLPKPLLEINNKSILEHQVELFNKMGLKDVNIIVGYQKEKFPNLQVNHLENPEYKEKGTLNSLMKAQGKMEKGFIYLNADLLIDERLIKELMGRKEDIVLVVDNSYLYHQHGIDKKLDAIITKRGIKPIYQKLRYPDEVLLIGREIPKEKMTHEFVGIAKFSKKGAENLIKIYKDLENHEGTFHESESFEKAGDTDMLQELVDRGIKIAVHETNGGWLEIHNDKDIKNAEEFIKN
jgi:phosphoenolpyruvate mutase